MKNKINIAELLKDCPKGMELDCTIFDGVKFDGIEAGNDPIRITIPYVGVMNLNKFGEHFMFTKNTKCIIFPKGKTTWEGFVPPCKFKDGDIVYVKSNGRNEYIIIFKEIKNDHIHKYVCFAYQHLSIDKCALCHLVDAEIMRLATEEETQKLFQAIKANGYKWNSETRTLEKLIEPKFKVGDKITFRCEEDKPIISIIGVKGNYYLVQYFNIIKGDYQNEKISFEFQDNYELVPDKLDVTTLKPFDKVLTRVTTGDVWGTDFFGYYKNGLFHCNGRTAFSYCIPYQGNEHLLGTTDDCDEHFKTWK